MLLKLISKWKLIRRNRMSSVGYVMTEMKKNHRIREYDTKGIKEHVWLAKKDDQLQETEIWEYWQRVSAQNRICPIKRNA